MLLCYAPVVHWIWGGGFLADGGIFGEVGVRDFAGGIVVHETAGLAALILAVFLGPTFEPQHAAFITWLCDDWCGDCCGSAGSALMVARTGRRRRGPRWQSP